MTSSFRPFRNRDALLAAVFLLLTLGLLLVPTGFEERVDPATVRCEGEVLRVDNDQIQRFGLIAAGDQEVVMRLADGPFKGREVSAQNTLLGQMDRDEIFEPGDRAFVVLKLDAAGEIGTVNTQGHYRIGLELLLLGMFSLALLAFGGWTGVKALLSFVFSGVVLWKVLVPGLLRGLDPVWLSLGVVTLLTAAIVYLVAGPTRKGTVAFLGAFLGVLASCLLAVYFTGRFHVHAAVMPFAETLLYSGFAHLNLRELFIAAIFLASSGAVMDLAMDVAASMAEVVRKKPDIGHLEAVGSGLRVGRAVVGTMTTTLLLAYSGGYVTLLMAFMAQGVPLPNTFNLIYVAAEALKTLVGSFGLVLVAPFTAVVGAVLYVGGERKRAERAKDLPV